MWPMLTAKRANARSRRREAKASSIIPIATSSTHGLSKFGRIRGANVPSSEAMDQAALIVMTEIVAFGARKF
jgi:hypothetical protein